MSDTPITSSLKELEEKSQQNHPLLFPEPKYYFENASYTSLMTSLPGSSNSFGGKHASFQVVLENNYYTDKNRPREKKKSLMPSRQRPSFAWLSADRPYSSAWKQTEGDRLQMKQTSSVSRRRGNVIHFPSTCP